MNILSITGKSESSKAFRGFNIGVLLTLRLPNVVSSILTRNLNSHFLHFSIRTAADLIHIYNFTQIRVKDIRLL